MDPGSLWTAQEECICPACTRSAYNAATVINDSSGVFRYLSSACAVVVIAEVLRPWQTGRLMAVV